ncbi:uncharacterized protein JN550_001309 [Neoarthrinium moseri]|uniref:uncharacterized protein n=1 Tax=Neoarthrinium moseri TaxID=1658444 RepID=UPI001FDB459E|nr:uncharacterized protein JN550_001309 [Neoarthrinium moseri]KAI1877237.1 hypothetical protein JN550_001309 [Neoarthrinium moseri]
MGWLVRINSHDDRTGRRERAPPAAPPPPAAGNAAVKQKKKKRGWWRGDVRTCTIMGELRELCDEEHEDEEGRPRKGVDDRQTGDTADWVEVMHRW